MRGLIMDRAERDRLIEEHDGNHVLHANVGHVAIADGIGLVAGDADDNFAHVVRGERALLEETSESVERSLNRRAYCPFLDVGAGDLVSLAKFFDQCGGIGFDDAIFARGESLEEIVRAGKNVIHAGPA